MSYVIRYAQIHGGLEEFLDVNGKLKPCLEDGHIFKDASDAARECIMIADFLPPQIWKIKTEKTSVTVLGRPARLGDKEQDIIICSLNLMDLKEFGIVFLGEMNAWTHNISLARHFSLEDAYHVSRANTVQPRWPYGNPIPYTIEHASEETRKLKYMVGAPRDVDSAS